MGELRNVHTEPPRFPVVTGDGRIKLITVEHNISGAIFMHEGDPMIAPAWGKLGWKMLRDLYNEEHNERGWKTFQGYMEAKSKGYEADAFPDNLLPKEVLSRRAGNTPGKKRWDPPTVDEAEERKQRGRHAPKES